MASLEALFRRYRDRGDVRALGTLFDRTADETLGIAMHFARDPAQAEEWTQEAYLIAIERASSWDPARRFMPWLLGILRNVVRRAHGKRATDPLPEAPLSAKPARDVVEDIEWTTAVAEAVEALDDPYRGVLILRLQHGLEPAEIARLQRVPAGTVRSQIHRGLMQLRDAMPEARRPQALTALAVPIGLASMRSNVLAAATAAAPVAAATGSAITTSTILGGLAVNKVLIAGAALTLLILGVLDPLHLWRKDDAEPSAAAAMPTQSKDVEPAPALAVPDKPTPAETSLTKPIVGPDVDLETADRDVDLHGLVVTADDEPVAGATVRLEHQPWEGRLVSDVFRRSPESLGETLTGPRGTFALRLRRGQRGTLVVQAPGHARHRLESVAAGERVRVVLGSAVALVIAATMPDGTPAAGLSLRVANAGTTTTVQTDATGRARVGSLARGWVRIDPIPTSRHPVLASPGAVQVPTTDEFALQLRSPARRRGRVSDASTDAPIPDATVGLHWLMEPHANTDSDGMYVLEGAGRRARLAAQAPGYARTTVETEDRVVDFALLRGSSVQGRVVDADGDAVPGAFVAAQGGELDADLSIASARTDAEGRFHLKDLHPDLQHFVEVRAARHGRTIVGVHTRTDGPELDDIVLGPSVALDGKVLRQDGTPGARLPVRVMMHVRVPTQAGSSASRSLMERVMTDDLGRFVIVDLCPGRFIVQCEPPSSPMVERSFNVRGAGGRGVPIRLQLKGPRTLHVRVLNPDGNPLTTGEVRALRRQGRKRIRARLDARGRATLELPEDVVAVRLRAPKDDALVDLGPIRVPETGSEMVIRQVRAVLIRGVVVTKDGTPVAKATVQGTRDGKPANRYAPTDEQGAFALKSVPGETLDLLVQGRVVMEDGKPRLIPMHGEVKGVTSGTQNVRLVVESLEGTRTLRIRVVDPEGNPLPEMTVLMQPYQSNRHGVTDAEGRITFEGLSASKRTVMVFGEAESGAPWSQQQVPAVPGSGEITIEMQRARRLLGRVNKPDGTPAANIMVHGFDPDDEKTSLGNGYTNDEGLFLIDLPPSATRIRFRASKTYDGRALGLDVVIDDIPADGVVLRLEPATDD